MTEWFKITPNFPHQDPFLPDFIENLLQEMLPPPTSLQELQSLLPLIHYSLSPPTLILNALSYGDFGHGTGRFISDLCSRWLLPGTQIPIVMSRSSSFTFNNYGRTQFFITQLVFQVSKDEELLSLQNHLDRLIKEMRLSILAVEKTRRIVSLKALTLKQKKIVLEENLASLLNRSKKKEKTIFDDAHHLIIKAESEGKMEDLHEKLSHLFDRDLFEEIHPFLSLFTDHFKAQREAKHLIRILSYQHLFKKFLSYDPAPHQISLKLFKSSLSYTTLKQPIVALLIGLNLSHDREILEEKHLLRAVQAIIPSAIRVPSSYLTDRRSNPLLRILYLEIKKPGCALFTPKELIELRRCLPQEIKGKIETASHPLFMEHPEDEIMKNSLTLSQELKTKEALPQVIIHFYKQTESFLAFTVILVRLISNKDKSLKELIALSSFAHEITDFSTKIVGTLKKTHIKEASVFEIHLNKKPFLRGDFSIDLSQGRQGVISLLTHLLGEIHDFNGGMVSLQEKRLTEFKKLLKGKSQQSDFLIEDFFYSLTPVYMQSLLSPSSLKSLFMMVLEALEHNFTAEPLFSKTFILHHTFMILLASPDASLIEILHSTLQDHKTLSSEVTCSKISHCEIHTLGFLMNFEDEHDYAELKNTLLSAVVKWQTTRLTPL